MNRTEKAELLGGLKEKYLRSQVTIFADFRGVTATQADELRKVVRNKGGEVRVLKNTVAHLLAKESIVSESAKAALNEIAGPTLVTFAYQDPAAVAKVFNEFAKSNEALKIKAGILAGKRVSAEEVTELANLPSKEVLLAKLLGTLNAPITSFVGVLAAVPRSVINAVSAIERKKSEGGN